MVKVSKLKINDMKWKDKEVIFLSSSFIFQIYYGFFPVLLICCTFSLPLLMVSARIIVKRSYADQSIRGYISEVSHY